MSKEIGGCSCSIAICRNTSYNTKKRGLTVRFFSFPKDRITRQEWILKCHREREINPDTARVCSVHFAAEDYEDGLKARLMGGTPIKLKRKAVPSLLISLPSPHPQHLATEEQEERTTEERVVTTKRPSNYERQDWCTPDAFIKDEDPNMSKEIGGHSCSIGICRNTSYNTKKRGLTVRFFSFPKDRITRREWILKCHREREINPDTARVCSVHFTAEDYEDGLKARLMGETPIKLKRKAVPSLLISPPSPHPQHLATEEQEERTTEERVVYTKRPSNYEGQDWCTRDAFIKDENPNVRDENHNANEIDILKRFLEEAQERIKELEKSNEGLKKANELMKIDYERAVEKKARNMLKDCLTENQIDILLNKKSRACWTSEELSRALTLRYISKRAYIYLRNSLHYPIPGLSTLRRWARQNEVGKLVM